MKNITLIGMPGSGKSSVGSLLAEKLCFEVVNTDLTLQRKKRTTLKKLWDREGTEAFLDLEADVVCELDCTDMVIVPGSTVVCRKRSMDHLDELGLIVYLKTPCEVLKRRVRQTNVTVVCNPGEDLEDIYDYRDALYEKYADLVIDCGDDTPEEIARRLHTRLKERGEKRRQEESVSTAFSWICFLFVLELLAVAVWMYLRMS